MKRNILFLMISLFIFNEIGISQSLSIQETVDYLNKIFIQTTHKEKIRPLIIYNRPDLDSWEQVRVSLDSGRHVYVGCNVVTMMKISIDREGFLIFQQFVTTTNCDDKKNNLNNSLRETTKINIDDIDLERMQWYLPEKIESPFDQQMLESNDNIRDCGSIVLPCIDKDVKCISQEYSAYNQERSFGYNLNIYSEDFKYDVKRFYNALVYLISSAKGQGYHKQKVDKVDPFVSPSIQANSDEKKSFKTVNEYKIPLKKEGGVFILTANISGIISKFILDSGAGETSFSSNLESKLIAIGIIKQKDYLSNGLYHLANGSIVECKRVKIPQINVGGKIIFNVIAAISPEGSPNLLGQSFLNKTNMWSIDNEKNCLIIR